ncbi:S-methyl-5-thioribose-1-phosphate isomerase [Leucobacter sp. gxy201]|uniref:S-methyl-5-thioribose-1-phosphate isomerase n=1 Tax=Leucobacter sp. gxy201 TaxID=2957200 RepID=UPI003DA079A7
MANTIEWIEGTIPTVRLLDQTRLPHVVEYLNVTTVAELVDAIQRLAVRGAPALGAAGGYGVALAHREAAREHWSPAEFASAVESLRNARPTAVNLAWGVDRVMQASSNAEGALAEAIDIANEDKAGNLALSAHGAEWIMSHCARRPLRVLTHCNTGLLATTSWGTAYGMIKHLHQDGMVEMVYADETRPLLQGSRLTSWELTQDGIPHKVQVDAAAASTITRGLVDVAIIGADRIAMNGDTANKIGSLSVALACKFAGIPFVVAAPFSTVSLDTATGSEIEIEERDASEVLEVGGAKVALDGTQVFNPAFDVTPAELISAIATEHGVIEPVLATNSDIFASLVPLSSSH